MAATQRPSTSARRPFGRELAPCRRAPQSPRARPAHRLASRKLAPGFFRSDPAPHARRAAAQAADECPACTIFSYQTTSGYTVAPNSGTTSSSGYTDAQVAAILASGSTVSTAQPCIMCHGMTADGQTGAVTQFAGLSAIPGSGPNAQLGYSVEANLTAGAVLTLGPGIAGGVTALGATAVLPDGMGIGIIQNGQVIAADLTVSTSHAALAAEAGVLGADGTLTGGAQAVTWTVENGQITTMASINFPSQTAGTQAAIRAYLTGLLNGGTP
jgi:hypothetical protein